MSQALYLDSSAIVKTIIRERESAALRKALRPFRTHVTSTLARAEVLRAVRRSDLAAVGHAHRAMGRLVLLDVTGDLLEDAGMIDPADLRTLDAIHLAAARSLGSDLAALITYDARLAAAATHLGLPVVTPN